MRALATDVVNLPDAGAPRLGLRANWPQFALLVLVNAFVGATIGLERTVLPLLAEQDFGLASRSAVLSFIATFGLVKAFTNLAAGRLCDRLGRKPVLLAGWAFGLPVPFLVIWAPTWDWIVVANVLLGLNQGLTWSTTVIMKVDLAGPWNRGLAMGLNEFAGYLAVALAALVTGYLASRYGLRPVPFFFGIGVVVLGFVLSVLFVRDTRGHVTHEVGATHGITGRPPPAVPDATTQSAAFLTANQAGLINNLNDGAAWGLFPLLFAGAGLPLRAIGILAFVYPAMWGVAQLGTGALSDWLGRKALITGGMLLQGGALLAIADARDFTAWLMGGALLGLGTAMAYPTLLAVISDVSPPASRGARLGAYRFWRDLGYALGALLAGVLADVVGIAGAIAGIGVLTIGSGFVVAVAMPETLPGRRRGLRRR